MKNDSSMEFRWKKTKVHFGVIGACMVFALSLLAQDIRHHELNSEIVRLDRERRDIEEERDRLMLQREHLRNPGRIREIATRDLGMVTPDMTNIHELTSANQGQAGLPPTNP